MCMILIMVSRVNSINESLVIVSSIDHRVVVDCNTKALWALYFHCALYSDFLSNLFVFFISFIFNFICSLLCFILFYF